MTEALPTTTREIVLTEPPAGLPTPEHFTIARTPLPAPGPGQVIVKNRYFLVFPGLRTLIGSQADGVPLPRIHTGDTLFGPAVGEVTAACTYSSKTHNAPADAPTPAPRAPRSSTADSPHSTPRSTA
jgi:NADPH-dependent curcumin reductase CurA